MGRSLWADAVRALFVSALRGRRGWRRTAGFVAFACGRARFGGKPSRPIVMGEGRALGIQRQPSCEFSVRNCDFEKLQTITAWRNLGVRSAAGWELPVSAARAAIYLPAGAAGPAFMVFDNFRTLLKYNNAASYALAVCLLADSLKGYAPIAARWPTGILPLSRAERIALQTDLARLGFNPGLADGILGSQTRDAVRAYQKSRGLVPDGYVSGP